MAATRTLDLSEPFTRGRALAAGYGDAQLRGRGFVRLYRGVYVSRAVP